jgi:hypothetical protein
MPQAARGKNMKMHQIAGTALIAMLPAQAVVVAQDSVMRDDTVRITDTQAWHEADLPYVRLLSVPPAPAPHWSLAGNARHGAHTAVLAQQVNAITPVPETSMYSMLLVGLGLLALCVPRDKQEKFDQGR